MNKVFPILLAASAAVGVLGAVRLAQDTNQVKLTNDPSYPLQMVSVSPQLSNDATEFRGAKVTLRNTGNVPCAAFAVSFILTFSNSETRRSAWQEDHIPLGYANASLATDRQIMPNQIYTAEATGLRVPAHEPATITGIEARIDYVEMADGKTYGEDQDKVGEAFRMTRWGHIIERKRLLDLYNTGGLEALLEELKRE